MIPVYQVRLYHTGTRYLVYLGGKWLSGWKNSGVGFFRRKQAGARKRDGAQSTAVSLHDQNKNCNTQPSYHTNSASMVCLLGGVIAVAVAQRSCYSVHHWRIGWILNVVSLATARPLVCSVRKKERDVDVGDLNCTHLFQMQNLCEPQASVGRARQLESGQHRSALYSPQRCSPTCRPRVGFGSARRNGADGN